jgi:hypothetical protein
MKTTIEVNGYEIVIEETDGMVSVSAMKDDEIVEEFQLEADSESFDGDDDMDMDSDVKDFDDFEGGDDDSFGGEEEEDFDSDDMDDDGEDEGDDDDESDEMEEEEGKLESFQSFLKKRK